MLDKPQAVLWDFDGTLVDTEPLWAQMEQEMLSERGLTFSQETFDSMRGQSAWLSAQMLADAFGEPERVREVFDDLHQRLVDHIASHELPWLPGARELMAELDQRGIPCAIVTASNSQIISAAVDRLPKNVQFIITADDVSETKPDPQCYLMAAQRLGLSPSDVVILEDSVPGVSAGLASGAVVYAYAGAVELPTHPRLFLSHTGLANTTFDELASVWRERKDLA